MCSCHPEFPHRSDDLCDAGRRTVLPFAVYSIMWRLIYIFVIAGAQAIEWPGVIMRIFVVVSQPIML